jgi:hypothetical protein
VTDWLIGIGVVVAVVSAGGFAQRLASIRADRLRAVDPKSADTLDQLRMSGVTPVAVPMHDRAFDKPA